MGNGHGVGYHANMPPQPSMSSIPSDHQDDLVAMTSAEKAKATYQFHKSVTSTQQSVGNVADLMNEIAELEQEDSGSVVYKTDDDFDSDEMEKVRRALYSLTNLLE